MRLTLSEILALIAVGCLIVLTIAVGHLATWW